MIDSHIEFNTIINKNKLVKFKTFLAQTFNKSFNIRTL